MILEQPPEQTAVDVVTDLTAAAMSMIPIVGGGIDHVMQAWFGPPLEKRRQIWFVKLWETIVEIAARLDAVVDDVIGSPSFQSAVFEASRIALGQHVEAKLDVLRAILEHHLLDEDRPDVVTRRYVRWVEEMDVEHVLVLRYAADPRGWYAERGLPLSSDPTASRAVGVPRREDSSRCEDPGSCARGPLFAWTNEQTVQRRQSLGCRTGCTIGNSKECRMAEMDHVHLRIAMRT